MLLMFISTPLFLIVSALISIIPDGAFTLESGITGAISMLSVAFQFFPVDVWIAFFASITFWMVVHFAYGVVNFILKLIPFVSMGQ